MATAIWASTQRIIAGTERLPVDTSGTSGPGYVQIQDVWNGYAPSTRTVTASTTATSVDGTVRGDATAGAIVVTLPAASSCPGKMLNFFKADSSANTVTVQGNASELINNSNTKVLATQFAKTIIQSNGTSWDVFV